jgi:hypothetical protein
MPGGRCPRCVGVGPSPPTAVAMRRRAAKSIVGADRRRGRRCRSGPQLERGEREPTPRRDLRGMEGEERRRAGSPLDVVYRTDSDTTDEAESPVAFCGADEKSSLPAAEPPQPRETARTFGTGAAPEPVSGAGPVRPVSAIIAPRDPSSPRHLGDNLGLELRGRPLVKPHWPHGPTTIEGHPPHGI